MSLRVLTWTVVALAALVLVACDDKDTADAANDAATTTAVPGAAETSAIPRAETSTTVPLDFDAEVAKIQRALDAADGDLCRLMEVTKRPLYVEPADEEQVEIVVDLLVDMVESMGEVAEPDDAQHYEDAADRLRDEAESEDYDPDWVSGPESFESFDDPQFFDASSRLQARVKAQCGTATPTSAP